jgi:hypothetical protein
LLLYRTVKNPYVMALSKSQGKKYWFNTRTGVAAFNIPPDSIAEVELTTPYVALSGVADPDLGSGAFLTPKSGIQDG